MNSKDIIKRNRKGKVMYRFSDSKDKILKLIHQLGAEYIEGVSAVLYMCTNKNIHIAIIQDQGTDFCMLTVPNWQDNFEGFSGLHEYIQEHKHEFSLSLRDTLLEAFEMGFKDYDKLYSFAQLQEGILLGLASLN